MSNVTAYRLLNNEAREIRLLNLFPASGQSALRAALVYTSLDNPLPYETISYCWGKTRARGNIWLNETSFDVPASSLKALRCVRKSGETRLIWIDAICINQDDIGERGSQVSLIAWIYQNSRLNLVYLGGEDAVAATAVVSIKGLMEEIDEKIGDIAKFRDIMRGFKMGTKSIPSQPIDRILDTDALLQFFSRPWFE
jgi:hypothetical protein